MGLLRKLRVLAGALVHKPFMPSPEKADLASPEKAELARPEKLDLDEGANPSDTEGAAPEGLDSGAHEADLVDGERVADLLAERQQERAD